MDHIQKETNSTLESNPVRIAWYLAQVCSWLSGNPHARCPICGSWKITRKFTTSAYNPPHFDIFCDACNTNHPL